MSNTGSKILLYHSVGNATGETGSELYSVPVDTFMEEIEYVKNAERDIIITFDDGDVTNYSTAFPLLKSYGLKAYFFILAGVVGTPGYMSWKEIKEMRDAGMVIGSHGMTHNILVGLSDERLTYELGKSKSILEDNLKADIPFLSVPRGFYDKKVTEKAKEAGYEIMFTSYADDRDDFKVGRVPVKSHWDLAYFADVINNGYSLRDRTTDFIKTSSARLLGVKNYDRLRTALLKTV